MLDRSALNPERLMVSACARTPFSRIALPNEYRFLHKKSFRHMHNECAQQEADPEA
jgi:hypothetical protein